MTGDDCRVRIPPDLLTKCKERIEGTNFDSVEEYVQFVMSQLVDGDEEYTDKKSPEHDSDAVTERLDSLGYL